MSEKSERGGVFDQVLKHHPLVIQITCQRFADSFVSAKL